MTRLVPVVPFLPCSLAILMLAFASGGIQVEASAAEPAPVSFNRDIRPIMSNTCFLCHGFDVSSREADLRLDLRDEALKPTKNGFFPIVPGKPEESEAYLRITDSVDPMPPEDSHKTLTAEQKETIRRWIAEGATYDRHWAYEPLKKPEPPRIASHPVDAFIRARLAERKIDLSPEADRAQLLRRVSLDLTGLPPTPEEVAAFVADRSPGAYERHVDRLLSSPRHGERMAVWWLDIVRFADTVGFHGDQKQRIFPYRDYVIDAFNTNKRFDQFTIEQLAGDLLPNATPEQRVATGYNRLNMMTREGGAQPREYLAKYGAERVRSVAAAWFGSTFGCAECHDHKFDPIKTRDFYELQGFFSDVRQWGVYSDTNISLNPDLPDFSNDHPFPPEMEVKSPYLTKRHDAIERELREFLAQINRRATAEAETPAFRRWQEEIRARLTRAPGGWATTTVTASKFHRDGVPREIPVTFEADGMIASRRFVNRDEHLELTLAPLPVPVAAIRLDVLQKRPASALPTQKPPREPMELKLFVQEASGALRPVPVIAGEAKETITRYKEGEEARGIATGWKIPESPEGNFGVWLPEAPVSLAEGETIVLKLSSDMPARFRLSFSPLAALDPLQTGSPEMLAALTAERNAGGPATPLFEAWLANSPENNADFRRYHTLTNALRETNGGRAWTMITEAQNPLTTRVLARGNWQDESGPVVLPATPSFLPGRLESTPEKRLTRLDLARWMVSPENPITARTVMNRLWALYFGTGLSGAIDDLGSQGELPSHPELLDWLAADFRDAGWDMRHMMRLIVTSAAYRQSSRLRPELREVDPSNRLLASQNPRRLDAEFVRDNALFIAGLLDLRDVGGPSIRPYQPAGYYAALQFPERDYVASGPEGQWRRGVYMQWQRTFLHPMLANFDAPARDECTAQRVTSNTPQQALTLLNDPTFVEAARVFAARLADEPSDTARLRRAFQLALARDPRPAEVASFATMLQSLRSHYADHRDEAEQLLQVGPAVVPAGDPVELASWTNVARVILNSHEVLTRY